MKEITVKSQAQLDALPKKFREYTVVYLEGSRFTLSVASGNSHVEARGNSHVEAWGNSHVVARENSHVVAWENSHVEAWENSHVEARGNSHVVAWGNSHVVARGNSHVVARENSHVDLLMLAICIVYSASAVVKAVSKLATIVKPKVLPKMTVSLWCQVNGIKQSGKSVTLFKRVSKDYKTQERTGNETVWSVGSKVEHPNYNPKIMECGERKFHACATPYLCDEFRAEKDDRYIAIRIKVADLYAWPTPEYPSKIAFRAGTVLYECDRYGKKI